MSVIPCKEVALRRVVPQAEISHLNRQYGHLCPLFNNDKKWRRHYWTKINVQNGFVKEQRECVERNEESIIPWLREEEMVRGEQTNNQKYNKIKQASKTNLGCEKKGRCKANNGQVVLCHWRPGVCNETNPCCWKWDKFLLFLQFFASKQRKARS